MDISAALAANLALLGEALDTDADLMGTLQQLAADAKDAVASYLGLTVTIVLSGEQINLTALRDEILPAEIGSSLMIELPSEDGQNPEHAPLIELIFYAGTPGAFVDLAADLSWLTGRDRTKFVLDQHRQLPPEPAPNDGLSAITDINQAIGVLISEGSTRDQASAMIDTLAARDGVDRVAAARQILAQLLQR